MFERKSLGSVCQAAAIRSPRREVLRDNGAERSAVAAGSAAVGADGGRRLGESVTYHDGGEMMPEQEIEELLERVSQYLSEVSPPEMTEAVIRLLDAMDPVIGSSAEARIVNLLNIAVLDQGAESVQQAITYWQNAARSRARLPPL